MRQVALRTLMATVLAGLAASSPAHAQAEGSGFYLGGSVGQTKVSDYCSAASGLSVSTCDDQDTGYKIFGGYRFNSNLGAEISYMNLGEYPATGTVFGTPFSVSTELTGFTAHAVGSIPVGDRFSLFGKLGLIWWDMKASAAVPGFQVSASDDGIDLAAGLGAQFDFTRNVGMRAEWDYFPNLGNSDTGEDNVHLLSLGVVFSF